MDPRTRMLLEAPVTRTILKLAMPNVVVMVVQASIGLIETYFVAKLGLDALAAQELVGEFLDAFEKDLPRVPGDDEEPFARALEVDRIRLDAKLFR